MPYSFNADLIDDVARRRIVLFVGAGASKWAKPTSGGDFKDWVEFLQSANTELKGRKRIQRLVSEMIEQRDYLLASELLKSNLENRWTSLLEKEFQQVADVSRLHKAMILLDPRIIVTTNFDKLIEGAWAQVPGARYPTVLTRVGAEAFRLFRSDEKYLIKLHGSIDEPGEIVFDKTSYQSGAFSNSYYSEILSVLLLTHTFLFVGFSMNDPAVSMVVENAAYRFPNARPHYVFQPGKAVPEVDDLWKRLRRLYVLRYPNRNDHVALAERLERLGTDAGNRRAEILASQRATVS